MDTLKVDFQHSFRRGLEIGTDNWILKNGSGEPAFNDQEIYIKTVMDRIYNSRNSSSCLLYFLKEGGKSPDNVRGVRGYSGGNSGVSI